MKNQKTRRAVCALMCLVLLVGGAAALRAAPVDLLELGRAGVMGGTFFTSPGAAFQAAFDWLSSLETTQTLTDSTPREAAPAQAAAESAPESAVSSSQTTDPVAERASGIPENYLPVQDIQYPSSGEGDRYLPLAAGSVRNLTDYAAGDIRAVLDEGGLPFSIELDSAEPQVLIMHTHATECYSEREGWVSPDNNGRTTDTAQNMVAVGDVLTAVLNEGGICTVHDATLHDYPSYDGSYERSNTTVQEWLATYPSIKVVLDVHRDAIETNGVRVKPTCLIDGQKAAQLMIISGADDGTMGMPNFWQNLKFAGALESAVEGNYAGLTRPVLFDYRNYNQQLTTGSLLFEIGGHGNTLEEAKYTARLIGNAMVKLFRGS